MKNVVAKCVVIVLLCSDLLWASEFSSVINNLSGKEAAKESIDALAKIGKPALPELIKVCEGKDKYKKRYAARAIREMGQDAESAIWIKRHIDTLRFADMLHHVCGSCKRESKANRCTLTGETKSKIVPLGFTPPKRPLAAYLKTTNR